MRLTRYVSCAASTAAAVEDAELAAGVDVAVVRNLPRLAALGSAIGLRNDMVIVDVRLARDIVVQ